MTVPALASVVDVERKTLDRVVVVRCAGVALILAALIVPLETKFAVLLATIGVMPLFLAARNGVERTLIMLSLAPLLYVSGALDRRHNLDVDVLPHYGDGMLPIAFLVRTEHVHYAVIDASGALYRARVDGAQQLDKVFLAWGADRVAVLEHDGDCTPRVLAEHEY